MIITSVEEGATERAVRSSRQRALLGAHHNAVNRFLASGDTDLLAPFEGQKVAGLTLLTDPDELEEAWRRGQLDFIEIYSIS